MALPLGLPASLPDDVRTSSLRVLVAAFGDAGHAFPAIALGRALAGRGHEVVVETWEERRAGGRGRRARLHRGGGIPDVPAARSRLRRRRPRGRGGSRAAAAAGGDAPSRRRQRHPHPGAGPGRRESRGAAGYPDSPHLSGGGAGDAVLRGGAAAAAHAGRAGRVARRAAGSGRRARARPARPQHAAGEARPRADRAFPRRDQPRPCAGRHLSPARVPAALAGGSRGDRADDLRAAPP